jgi:hypothetical protein
MLDKKGVINMKQVARKIEAGLYEYRGYSIENMKDRAGADYVFWNIAEIPSGETVYQAHEAHDSTNTLAEAKQLIDVAYYKESA